jgi:ADP-ribosyl-[dinitrogen reductase] hydrolase
MLKNLTKAEKFRGCIIGGAIGDAFGSAYENQNNQKKDNNETFYLFSKPLEIDKKINNWQITDDTQLTLATVEAMIIDKEIKPEILANTFLKYYKQRILKGLGASTLKALRELEVGGHWALVGRKGEYAAGNGAAMRIAPLAFEENLTKRKLRDICSITHQNDEAYVGALCIIYSIKAILNKNWLGKKNLMELIIPQIPDTRIRDRLIEIKDIKNIKEIGKLGNDGYVVNSVPLAIAAANQISQKGIEEIFNELIEIGGDTDTNCSMTGQIIGCLIGVEEIPINLQERLIKLHEYNWINQTIEEYITKQNWNDNI